MFLFSDGLSLIISKLSCLHELKYGSCQKKIKNYSGVEDHKQRCCLMV